MAIHQDLEEEVQDPGYVNHDFTWMPSDMADCPCDECQDQIDREAARERKAIWPWRLNWRVHILKGGKPGTCPCGEYLETVQDWDHKKKEIYFRTEPHILVQVYGQKSLGDGFYFTAVTDIPMHIKCGTKVINSENRIDWDMETRAKDVLVLESLPDQAKAKIRSLSRK